MAALEFDSINMSFSGVHALRDVSFQVEAASITSLIGPNGAGKTTLINIATGVLRPTQGEVRYRGRDISGAPTYRIAQRGLRRTFQTVHLFPGLTVLENLIVGQHTGTLRRNWSRTLLPFACSSAEQKARCLDILRMFGLEPMREAVATDLPYGLQRRVEIARALAGEPSLILLDEPAAGMNEQETAQLRGDIERIREAGITVFLVEHDMSLVMKISDHIVVLDFGQRIAEGPPDEVRRNPAVIQSYLGV